MAIYTLAGSISSTFVGGLLGWLGGVFGLDRLGGVGLLVALTVALVAVTRELGWISFRMPQLPRQTRDIWFKVFSSPVAAGLWGFDLGLVFSTWLTFSGVWLLVVIAMLGGEAGFGATLFGVYWLGRVLSVWIAPHLMPDSGATSRLMDAISGQYRLFQRIHIVGLAWVVVVFVFWLANGIPM